MTSSPNFTADGPHCKDRAPSTEGSSSPPPSHLPTPSKEDLSKNTQGPAWIWDLEREPTSYFCKTRQRTIEQSIRPSVPPGAFCIFSQECKARIRKREPFLPSKVLMKKVQKEWRQADQQLYKRLAAELYSDYRLLLSWWRVEYAPTKRPAKPSESIPEPLKPACGTFNEGSEQTSGELPSSTSIRMNAAEHSHDSEAELTGLSKTDQARKPDGQSSPASKSDRVQAKASVPRDASSPAARNAFSLSDSRQADDASSIKSKPPPLLPPCTWVLSQNCVSVQPPPGLSVIDKSVLKRGLLGKRNLRWEAAAAELFNNILSKLEKRAKIH